MLDKPPFKKFPSWREHQQETVFEVLRLFNELNKRIVILKAPTGAGKSCIAMSVAYQLGITNYLVCTKQLQAQLAHDFLEARLLKGRSNYNCKMQKGLTCDLCPVSKPMDEENGCEDYKNFECEYQVKKAEVLAGRYRILNYSYSFNEFNYVGRFAENVDFLILDEGDLVEKELMNFVELKLTSKQLDKLRIKAPEYKTKFESWKEWAKALYPGVQNEINLLKPYADSGNIPNLRHLKSLEALASKIRFFIDNVNEEWVFDAKETEWVFRPLWASTSGLVQEYLLQHGQKALLMSATVDRETINDLGLNKEEVGYLEMPCAFEVDRRLVYYMPVVNITYKTKFKELPILCDTVKDLMSKHPKEKGLIHTVSYQIADYLITHINSNRLMTHKSKNRTDMLEEFKASNKPLVMISPSMDRGVDLKFDLARWQIICKVPYLNLSDRQVSKRLYSGKRGEKWYRAEACRTIQQASGRIVRDKEDYGVTYILDKQFGELLKTNASLFPTWWRDALSFVKV